jgi:hypothetical protein
MNIKQLIKMVKADTKKFLKSKDGKNYCQLIKNGETYTITLDTENNVENLRWTAKGVN